MGILETDPRQYLPQIDENIIRVLSKEVGYDKIVNVVLSVKLIASANIIRIIWFRSLYQAT
jgi:hypothetical protein